MIGYAEEAPFSAGYREGGEGGWTQGLGDVKYRKFYRSLGFRHYFISTYENGLVFSVGLRSYIACCLDICRLEKKK